MGIALLVLGVVAAVVGGLMLLVAAFRTSVPWGLVCLLPPLVGGLLLLLAAFQASVGLWVAGALVPFAGLAYVVAHWDDARLGFLLNLAGLAVAALGLLFLPTDGIWGGELTGAGWQEPAPPAWEQPERTAPDREWGGAGAGTPGFGGDASGEGGLGGAGAGPEGGDPAAPALGPPTPSPSPRSSRREEVLRPSEAGAYVGKLVTIVQHDGKAFKARLRGIRGGWVFLDRPVGGGSVAFPMPAERIREIRVSGGAR